MGCQLPLSCSPAVSACYFMLFLVEGSVDGVLSKKSLLCIHRDILKASLIAVGEMKRPVLSGFQTVF